MVSMLVGGKQTFVASDFKLMAQRPFMALAQRAKLQQDNDALRSAMATRGGVNEVPSHR